MYYHQLKLENVIMTSQTNLSRDEINQWIESNRNEFDLWKQINLIYANKYRHPSSINSELLNLIPPTIHKRLDYAARYIGSLFFSNDGLFLAPAGFDQNQYGVYTWVELLTDEILIEYAGRIWNRSEIYPYLSNYPEILLRKQKYFFSVPKENNNSESNNENGDDIHHIQNSPSSSLSTPESEEILDPTNLNGYLYNIFNSHNLGPYFNEPGYSQHANCFVEFILGKENMYIQNIEHFHKNESSLSHNSVKGSRGRPSKSKNRKRIKNNGNDNESTNFANISYNFVNAGYPSIILRIHTCSHIAPFSELYILYEQSNPHYGIGNYELRNYLVGVGCNSSIESLQKQQQLQKQIELMQTNPVLLQGQLNRIEQLYAQGQQREWDSIAHLNANIHMQQYKFQYYFIPTRKQIFVNRVNRYVWSWSDYFGTVENNQELKTESKSTNSDKSSDKNKFINIDENEKIRSVKQFKLVALKNFEPGKKLLVFGISISSEVFYEKLLYRSSHDKNKLQYLISCKSGFFDADPDYEPWQNIGGHGTFIWTWIQHSTDVNLINMRLDSRGYFETTRTILMGEILYLNPRPNIGVS